MNRPYRYILFIILLTLLSQSHATTDGYRLIYSEIEQGASPSDVRYLITDDFLRIDDLDDPDGYILFDVRQDRIYSISHLDESVLVIDKHEFPVWRSDDVVTVDKALTDAPKVAGKIVRDYRVELTGAAAKQLCTQIQYVPDLLKTVTSILQRYQLVVSGNQAKIIDRTPVEYQTPCMLADQVYNRGDYYSKGLPIQEWHSNGKQKLLKNYAREQIDDNLFLLPETYRQFSTE